VVLTATVAGGRPGPRGDLPVAMLHGGFEGGFGPSSSHSH
jgi:hypothetical protein